MRTSKDYAEQCFSEIRRDLATVNERVILEKITRAIDLAIADAVRQHAQALKLVAVDRDKSASTEGERGMVAGIFVASTILDEDARKLAR